MPIMYGQCKGRKYPTNQPLPVKKELLTSICSICGKRKPNEEFTDEVLGNDQRRVCKKCRFEIDRAEGTKVCHRCGEEKSLLDFNVNSSNKDGYDLYCRDCRKILRDESKLRGKHRNASKNTGS